MRSPVYRYNAETCRYERTKRSWFSIFIYLFGLLLTAASILIGLLVLHDLLFDSATEIKLRNENKAIKKNYALLTKELEPVEEKLKVLSQKDNLLHKKFFVTEQSIFKTDKKDFSSILFFSASDFPETFNDLTTKSKALMARSTSSNYFFADQLSLTDKNLSIIRSLPLIIPVKSFEPSMLLSGFGMRIHPFHKGLYNHPGVDIALPRGTEIICPAEGVVVASKRSDLQAGYGNYIEIDHGNNIVTRYAHLDEIFVKTGQKILKGSVIALSGNSGGSIAPHLHYEIIRDGKNTNPVQYMVSNVNSEMHTILTNISSIQNQSLD